jgi:tetratricopeptide (TPR) repeat protein
MYQEDFILRLIRMATAAIARAMGYKTIGEYRMAIEVLDQMLEDVLGMSAMLVHSMEDDSLLDALSNQNGLDTDRLYIVADLLKAEGDIYAEQHEHEDAQQRYMRALVLYLEGVLADSPEIGGGPVEKIENLLKLVPEFDLDPETRFSLFMYLDGSGAYRRAEATLQGLLEKTGLKDELRPEFVAFYERMLAKSEAELVEAGMARGEIDAKLAGWKD